MKISTLFEIHTHTEIPVYVCTYISIHMWMLFFQICSTNFQFSLMPNFHAYERIAFARLFCTRIIFKNIFQQIKICLESKHIHISLYTHIICCTYICLYIHIHMYFRYSVETDTYCFLLWRCGLVWCEANKFSLLSMNIFVVKNKYFPLNW